MVEQLKELIAPKHNTDIRVQSMSDDDEGANKRALAFSRALKDVYSIPTEPIETIQNMVLRKIVKDEILAKEVNNE